MNKKLIGNIIGIILICIACIPSNFVPNIVPEPKPSINLDINKPSEDILNAIKPINLLIKDNNDRIKFAVFNYVFSKRVIKYDTTVQTMQDIYVLAAQDYFKDSLKDKYENLDELLKSLFISIVGESDHILSNDEKIGIQNLFSGLSWGLIK